MSSMLLANYPKYSTFTYWFVRTNTEIVYDVYRKDTKEKLGKITDLPSGFRIYEDKPILPEICKADFAMFHERPEFIKFQGVYDQDTYERTLLGVFLIHLFRNIKPGDDLDAEENLNRINACLEWLKSTDFYTCPASSRYHECYDGGLLAHTLKVAKLANELCRLPIFKAVNCEEAIFVALVHDWCKIGYYESYEKNVKNASGNWVKEKAYKTRDTSLTCFGHGVSSMFLVQRFFNISVPVALAIRWHMAAWRVVDSEMNELQQANETTPLVHLIQFADQLSITKYPNPG